MQIHRRIRRAQPTDAVSPFGLTGLSTRTFQYTSADGTSRPYTYVDMPVGVVVLPLLDSGSVLMLVQERPLADCRLLELPAGRAEPGETPNMAAQRELLEETGYQANGLVPLTSFYPSNGATTEVVYAFAATELEHVNREAAGDSGEAAIEIVRLAKLRDLLYRHELAGASTIVATAYFLLFGAGGGTS